MFGKLMNNYYYGKSGKSDYTPDDLPKNRWQLFLEMLRTRLSGLVRLNLMYMLIWLPFMIATIFCVSSILQTVNYTSDEKAGIVEQVEQSDGSTVEVTYLSTDESANYVESVLFLLLIAYIPCIAITGPFTAGCSYVTRNWARDEHAFIWTDFKDAMKANWKQSLVVSLLTGLMPIIMYMGWRFYGQMSAGSWMYVIPQVLILMIGIMWSLAVTYMYPLLVTYDLRMIDVFRNAFLLAVARLPMSVGIRLLHCVPMLICLLITELFGSITLLILAPFVWYVIAGFALSRFVTASYTNSVFDKYINSRIEGVEVNRGLAKDDDDDDDEEEITEV